MPRWGGPGIYVQGLRASIVENATAYGFSIMVTGTYGVVTALEPRAASWVNFLWAFGAVAGFTLVMLAATKGLRERETDAEKSEVEIFAALMNFFSVLGGIGAAALVAWLATGWWVWLSAPLGASATYILLNGFEYAAAEEEDDDG